MGWLAAQGAIMAIGLFIGLVCSVIGLFFGHIILFDSIALGIAAGVCCNQFTAIHPALCLVIGIATFLLLLWLQNTSIGFWLVGGLLTLIYAAVFGLLAYFISEHDPIWGWVIFGLVFLVVGALHLRARELNFAASNMFVSIVTAKGYLNIYNHSFQSHLSRFQTRFS